MNKEASIHVLILDDNPFHRYVFESICSNFSHVTLMTRVSPLKADFPEPDLILINLNPQCICVRHLISISRELYPQIPIIGYLNTFNEGESKEHIDIEVLPITVMSYHELLLQFSEYLGLLQVGDSIHEQAPLNSNERYTGLTYFKRLSPREKDIFCLLGKGLGTIEIAEIVNCSPRTVETHIRKIGDKLNEAGLFRIRRIAIQEAREWKCQVLSDPGDHRCIHIGNTVGHCPYLKAQ
ncbi:LuxR C-terminal-related transcriptional regulator [Pontiellaceae bacterium B12219]|nr:LuxR C-terminal-related transcriptional regulator [Pontiellaceae bacterium B12219]